MKKKLILAPLISVAFFATTASAQNLGDLLNKANRALQGGGQVNVQINNAGGNLNSPYLANAYFKTYEEFGSFFATYNPGMQLDNKRLAASVEHLIRVSGGNFVQPGGAYNGPLCAEKVRDYGGAFIQSIINFKRAELTNTPPTFYAPPGSSAARQVTQEIANLKNYMVQAYGDDAACKHNASLLDTVVQNIDAQANAVNEQRRVPLKDNYQKQLAQEAERKKADEAAAALRKEEEDKERARVEAEKREQVAKQIEAERKEIEEKQRIEAEKKAKRSGG